MLSSAEIETIKITASKLATGIPSNPVTSDKKLSKDSALITHGLTDPATTANMNESFLHATAGNPTLRAIADLKDDKKKVVPIFEIAHATGTYGPMIKAGSSVPNTLADVRVLFPGLVEAAEAWVQANPDLKVKVVRVGCFKKHIPYTPIVLFLECPAFDELLDNLRDACPQLDEEYTKMHEDELKKNPHYKEWESYARGTTGSLHFTIGGITLSWDDFVAYCASRNTTPEAVFAEIEAYLATRGLGKGSVIPIHSLAFRRPEVKDLFAEVVIPQAVVADA